MGIYTVPFVIWHPRCLDMHAAFSAAFASRGHRNSWEAWERGYVVPQYLLWWAVCTIRRSVGLYVSHSQTTVEVNRLNQYVCLYFCV